MANIPDWSWVWNLTSLGFTVTSPNMGGTAGPPPCSDHPSYCLKQDALWTQSSGTTAPDPTEIPNFNHGLNINTPRKKTSLIKTVRVLGCLIRQTPSSSSSCITYLWASLGQFLECLTKGDLGQGTSLLRSSVPLLQSACMWQVWREEDTRE